MTHGNVKNALNDEHDAKIIPINRIQRTIPHKNLIDIKNKNKINLIIPNIPNFNNNPADNNDIDELASQ
jgi:hypothetical protein